MFSKEPFLASDTLLEDIAEPPATTEELSELVEDVKEDAEGCELNKTLAEEFESNTLGCSELAVNEKKELEDCEVLLDE